MKPSLGGATKVNEVRFSAEFRLHAVSWGADHRRGVNRQSCSSTLDDCGATTKRFASRLWRKLAAASTQRDDDDFDRWVTEKGGPEAVVAMIDDMKRRVADGSLPGFRDKEALLSLDRCGFSAKPLDVVQPYMSPVFSAPRRRPADGTHEPGGQTS